MSEEHTAATQGATITLPSSAQSPVEGLGLSQSPSAFSERTTQLLSSLPANLRKPLLENMNTAKKDGPPSQTVQATIPQASPVLTQSPGFIGTRPLAHMIAPMPKPGTPQAQMANPLANLQMYQQNIYPYPYPPPPQYGMQQFSPHIHPGQHFYPGNQHMMFHNTYQDPYQYQHPQPQIQRKRSHPTDTDTAVRALSSSDDEDDDSTADKKTLLSRHVTSVLTHFTSTPEAYSRLLNEIDDYLHVVSTEGILLYSSPAVTRYLAHLPSDLLNIPLDDIVHPDDRVVLADHRALSLQSVSEEEFTCYIRYRTKGDVYLLFEVKGKHVTIDESEYILQSAREYESKGRLTLDAILELRIENLRLRRQLELMLNALGMDPTLHPLLVESVDLAAYRVANPKKDLTTARPTPPMPIQSKTPILTAKQPVHDSPAAVHQSATEISAMNAITSPQIKPEEPFKLPVNTIHQARPLPNFAPIHAQNVNPMPFQPIPQRPHQMIPMHPPMNTTLQKPGITLMHQPHLSMPQIHPQHSHSQPVVRMSNLPNQLPAPEKKKPKANEDLFCRQCGTTNSPEWRRGPSGPKTLCNACGLAFSKKSKRLSVTNMG